MRIVVIGTGYVGLVSGACFAELGNEVICVDKVAEKIDALKQGRIPIYEPGLEKLVFRNAKEGRLSFTLELKDALDSADMVFLAVGTPTSDKDGSADLSYVFAAAEEIAAGVSHEIVVVTKSTVPVGTGEKLAKLFAEKRPDIHFHLCSNPEFLREGSAVEDFMYPDRIVVGTASQHATELMKALYAPLTDKGSPLLITQLPTAELLKYAANAFLATKLGFVNEMADICEKVGADIMDVTRGMGLDRRIGETYLSTGPGYGGSCLPKDTNALAHTANEVGASTSIVETVIAANDKRKLAMVDKIVSACGGEVDGKTISLLGLTFKANTDDMRYSVSLTVIPELLKRGAVVKVYDPIGMDEAKKWLAKEKDEFSWCESAYDACRDGDAVVILTEWDEFRTLDLKKLREKLKQPVFIDLRNLYSPAVIDEAGFRYVSLGR